MSAVGYGFAESYVQRDLHKRKLKMENEERAKLGRPESESEMVKSSSGCFFWPVLKKVHPTIVPRTRSAETEEVRTLNHKD
ncbi:hypothetical protein TB2_043867 [Malus domestica]